MADPLMLTLATSVLLRCATAGIRVVLGSSLGSGCSPGDAAGDAWGELVKSLTDTVEGMSSNAAHDYLKKVIAGAESLELDPATKMPRNHDLQRASCDALRGAAQALVWELATQVQLGKPWLPSLQEHLGTDRLKRLFAEDAVRDDPKRRWVERLHALVGGAEFDSLHQGMLLGEAQVRACMSDTVSTVNEILCERFGQWTHRHLGSEGEPAQFAVLLAKGWRAGPEGPNLTLGLLYTHFLREYLKRRPEVFRILVTDELSSMRKDLAVADSFNRAALSGFAGEFAGIRGYFAAHDDQMGALLRGHAQLGEQLGQLLALVTTLGVAHQRGSPEAGEQLRRLSSVETKLDYLLGGIPLARVPRPRAPTKETELLMAQYRALPLTGRDGELDSLRDWLASPHGVSARLLIGSAGSGKTRLAIELLREIEDLRPHWIAGVLRQEALRQLIKTKDLTQLGWSHPTLVLVDYAQPLAEPLSKLLSALADGAAVGRPRLRVLLLDRVGGAWFDELLRTGEMSSYSCGTVRQLFDPPHAVPIPPLPVGAIRRDLLGAALAAAARLQGRPPPSLPDAGVDPAIDAQLAKSRYGEPLQLAMAAVVATDTGLSPALACSRLDLVFHVARREGARLGRFVPDADGALARERAATLRHLAACATLEQGFINDELVRAAAEELEARRSDWPGGNGALERLLRQALPSERLAVAPIEPDFVGEAFVLAELAQVDAAVPAANAVAWSDAVTRCARRDPRATPATLLHAWQNFGNDARCAEVLLIATDALIAVAEKNGETALLDGLADAMPESSLEFCARAARLTGVLYAAAKQKAAAQGATDGAAMVALARQANILGVRLSALGQREEALAAAQEAVDLYRELTQKQPDAFRPGLASSLGNVAIRLSDLGQREEALAIGQEAAGLYRELAQKQPDAFRPNLALALNNVASMLNDLGQREEALVAMQEAVAIQRELAEKQPDTFRSDLAGSLNNVANALSGLGQREEALAPAQEAVGLYRELAQKQPDAFRPDLAMSLNNVANALSGLGQWEEALAIGQEAAGLYRELVEKQPDTFRPDLAGSLNNVANRLSDLGQREEALAPAQEAVGLYRELAKKQPDAFRPDLAMSLNNVANRLSDLGQREEALAIGQEAAGLYRELAQKQPDAFRPDLAMSLSNVAIRLSYLDQGEEALAAAQEAVDLCRELARKQPDAFRPELARSLTVLGFQLVASSRHNEAADVYFEGIYILRPAFLKYPAAFAALFEAMIRGYFDVCNEAGIQPNAELIALQKEMRVLPPGEEGLATV